MDVKGKRLACSWSGGKESALALHQAVASGGVPVCLMTMMVEDGSRSRSHGLPRWFLEAQAASLGLPLVTRDTSWDDYEEAFVSALEEARTLGAEAAVFGDIDIEEHRRWTERVCKHVGIGCAEPLWQRPRRDVMAELTRLSFRAVIVTARSGVVDKEVLGKELSEEVLGGFEARDVDICGELGEYHTAVVGGPLFRQPISFRRGETIQRDGVWFLELLSDSSDVSKAPVEGIRDATK